MALPWSCKTATPSSTLTEDAVDASTPSSSGGICLGVRGNGVRMLALTSATARMIETVGLMDGYSGGSSASVTGFLYESILLNPGVNQCGDRTCTQSELRERVALMMKSIAGFFDVASDDSAVGFLRVLSGQPINLNSDLAEVLQGLPGDVDGKNVYKALARYVVLHPVKSIKEAKALLHRLRGMMDVGDLRGLINPAFFKGLQDAIEKNDLASAVVQFKRLTEALKSYGAFGDEGAAMFLRDGPIDMAELAGRLGIVADFYAGRGYGADYRDHLAKFFAACSSTTGKSWRETVGRYADQGTRNECGEAFAAFAATHPSGAAASRLDDVIGKPVTALGQPLKIIASTALLSAGAVEKFASSKQAFDATGTAEFAVDFADVRFGYAGQENVLQKINETFAATTNLDLKSAKFAPLGPMSWRQVLTMSISEPGLAPGLPIESAAGVPFVSIGGWPDPTPAQILAASGCRIVALLSRPGMDREGFYVKVSRNLGLKDPTLQNAYFDSTVKTSAIGQALLRSDLTICPDYDNHKYDQPFLAGMFAMAEDAYQAPIRITASDDGVAAELKALAPDVLYGDGTAVPGCWF